MQKLITFVALSMISSVTWSEFAQAEMIVETKNGQTYTLPVQERDLKSIRFSNSPTMNPVWQGTWDTSEGMMNLSQSDGVVQGRYSQDNGRIRGQVNGNTLNGYWIEDSSAQRCSQAMDGSFHWGRISFNVNGNGNEFQGLWSYCNSEPQDVWSGSKL